MQAVDVRTSSMRPPLMRHYRPGEIRLPLQQANRCRANYTMRVSRHDLDQLAATDFHGIAPETKKRSRIPPLGEGALRFGLICRHPTQFNPASVHTPA